MESARFAILNPRSDIEAIAEDIQPYVGTTVAERAEIMERLCEFAAEQVAARADGWRVLAYQDRRSAASRELWRTLVERSRVGR
ncbi:MAG TPA: hypothetical protein VF331_02645 [Polyangiales bacterium]